MRLSSFISNKNIAFKTKTLIYQSLSRSQGRIGLRVASCLHSFQLTLSIIIILQDLMNESYSPQIQNYNGLQLQNTNKISLNSHNIASPQFQSHQNSEIEISFLQNNLKTQTPNSVNRPQQWSKNLRPRRKEQSIEITSLQTMKRRQLAKKGRSKQTTNLGKYVYREIMSFLQLIFMTNQMTPSLLLAVTEFKKQKGGLSSYKRLFQHPVFLKTCLQNLETADFVRSILQSTRMEMRGKLTIIKFLERIRMNCIGSKGRWKQQEAGEGGQTF